LLTKSVKYVVYRLASATSTFQSEPLAVYKIRRARDNGRGMFRADEAKAMSRTWITDGEAVRIA
jgi:hypothetical protein